MCSCTVLFVSPVIGCEEMTYIVLGGR